MMDVYVRTGNSLRGIMKHLDSISDKVSKQAESNAKSQRGVLM
jgi:bisphosphoglycerate-dependent phosphoglycerate mutase